MTDLIKKLIALEPAEGEWKYTLHGIFIGEKRLYNDLASTSDDDQLVSLAPLMRTEILKMDEEIKFLNQRIESLLKQLKDGSPF